MDNRSSLYRRCLQAAGMLLTLCLLPLPATAEQPATPPPWRHGLSFQGFTGLLNTPSAYVQELGTLEAHYTNQVDSHWTARHGLQENYLFSIGMFGFAEIGARLTEAFRPRGVNDLSAQAKLSTQPLTAKHPWLPVLAIGMQDIGGGAKNLQSKYLVASSELWRFRLSAGYGTGPDRMKGLFGGAEFIAHDWVRVLAEYDTRDTNLGLRLQSPRLPLVPVSLMFTGKTTVSGSRSGTVDFTAGFSIPLDLAAWNRPPATAETTDRITSVPQTTAPAAVPSPQPPADQPPLQGTGLPLASQEVAARPADPLPVSPVAATATTPAAISEQYLHSLHKQLEAQGFIRIKAGLQGNHHLVVRYENVRFAYNELDALGVVAGTVATTAPESAELLTLITVRKGIAMQAITMPLPLAREFFKPGGGSQRSLVELRDMLKVSANTDPEGVTYPESAPATGLLDYLPPINLTLAPGLKTHVGTEVAVFDYLLSLRPEITVNPWKGGVLYAGWNLPFAWSDNYDRHKPFAYERENPGIDRLQLSQGIKVMPSLMLNLGGGILDQHWYGTLNELVWMPGDGRHRVQLMQAWAESEQTGTKEKNLYLGSYRYSLPQYDLSLEATGGRFWNQDEGFQLALKRFFGDVAVSLYYKNVTLEHKEHLQAAGIQFSLPFTVRKNIKQGPVTVGGTDEWQYAEESTITTASRPGNYIVPYAVAAVPQNATSLERSYYNRDRLTQAYTISHLERLRDAWNRFRPAERENNKAMP